ncbi:ECF subfamily RNA polymerase sigma-24 factor, partial [Candidatus Omnitrophus magneticus]
MESTVLSDSDIVEEVLSGNVEVFEGLVKRYDALVFKIVSRHIPYEMVGEVAHEVFVSAYLSLNTYKGTGTFKSWVAKISVRCCLDFWREKYRKKEIPISYLSDEPQQWFETIIADKSFKTYEKLQSKKYRSQLLEYALSRLSADDRMVLSLLYFEGFSVKETAELLRLSVVNVKVRAYRLRGKLRE